MRQAIFIFTLLILMPRDSTAQTTIQNNTRMNDTSADQYAREILSKMTLREKVYEMHGHGLLRFGLSALFTKNIKPVIAGGNKRLGIPGTIFLDGPRGIFRNTGATAFPVTMARGASWDPDLERRVGEAMGEENRAFGGNYSGAVCMNLLRHPAWGRAQETYGEDPYHIGEMASALVDGIQKHNVQACVKHFAANSMENNRLGGNIKMDERTLQEVYLPHFKKVIQHGAASVMSAYNQLNGEFCGHSKHLLTDILVRDWGFRGYVTSDWAYGLRDAEKGIKAGMNVEMPGAHYYRLSKIKKLISDGKITGQEINDLVLPIIRTKLLFAGKKDIRSYPKALIGCREHTDLAREVAEKSAVLLKNENNILPFDKTKVKRIAVIGSLADVKQTGDHGSSIVAPSYIITPLEGIRKYLEGTNIVVLYAASGDTEAVKNICANADAVIIAAGYTYLDEGEYIGAGKIRDRENPGKRSFFTKLSGLGLGGDRKYLHLHQQDIDVIHLAASINKNVVVSLVAGSAVTVEEWHTEVPAIIETFYNGMEGGNALARILFGDVNPSGKLPFTVPKSESDLPPFDSYATSVDYGYYHGYSLFDKKKIEPRYPFGYGLSYTSFTISDLHVGQSEITAHDSVKVTVRVKNTGSREGAEVVQLYIGFPDSKIDRPEKLLRGFRKVYLKPNEEQQIEFSVPASELAYYNVATKSWEIEKSKYEVLVGNSSSDDKLLRQVFAIR
jgi:beta-glucosidase